MNIKNSNRKKISSGYEIEIENKKKNIHVLIVLCSSLVECVRNIRVEFFCVIELYCTKEVLTVHK